VVNHAESSPSQRVSPSLTRLHNANCGDEDISGGGPKKRKSQRKLKGENPRERVSLVGESSGS